MVTYTYSVSSSGPSSSIQAIINNVVSELATYPTITRDIEIIVGKGNYSGFTIPDASLFALYNTGYKLIIKSGGTYFPIIDFNHSLPSQVIGIDVGSGNPNVVIERLRVQHFAVGVRSSTNSHFTKVKNCIISNNRNAGIFFDQVNQAQAIQNIIINGDYGIVNRLCKSAINIHNTIFMNGAIASTRGRSISCIWSELANDYGNGISDKGTLHLIGNVGWNTSGRCLTLFIGDLETEGAVVTNFNDWVVGNPEEFITVEDNAFYRGSLAVPRVVYRDLNEFRSLGKDLNSISQDPKFISAVKIRSNRNGYAVDLNLLPVSPVLGLVPSFAYNPSLVTEWLPSYFDSADISKDLLNNTRSQSVTAAGANEVPSSAGFFGQDIFSDPIDLDIIKDCNRNPFSNVLYKSLDLWYPKLNAGYFYSNEREYYLYSKKRCNYIGEIAETTFTLPSQISTKKLIKIKVAGSLVDKTYYDLFLNKLTIYHKDLQIVTREEEVVVEGFITSWKDASFNYSPVLYIQKINQGETKYYLPSDYTSIGPVIITDDRCSTTDSDKICNREFSLHFDSEVQKTEVVFNNTTNRLTNSQFDYYNTDNLAPLGFNSYNVRVETAGHPRYSIAGTNICKIEADGFLEKVVSIDTGNSYNYSFYSCSEGSGTLDWTTKYYDSNYNFLGVVQTGSVLLTDNWARNFISFNPTTDLYTGISYSLGYSTNRLASLTPPTTSSIADIRLSYRSNPAYTGACIISSAQYEQSNYPTLFNRLTYLNELTIEYETSNSGFTDTRLSLSPVVTLFNDGFIYIPELPSKDYGGPIDLSVTTLHEWRWPEGRKNIIPWARTKGKDKLRKRTTDSYHAIPQVKQEILAPANFTSKIRDIDLLPSFPSTFVEDNNGVGFTIKVTDEYGNPYGLAKTIVEIFDDNLKNPGLLYKSLYGIKEQLGPAIFTKTDMSGSITILWVPPSSDSGTYRGGIPSPTLSSVNGDLISIIDTEYPVNPEVYGNIIILDSLNNRIKTTGTPITGIYSSLYLEDNSIVVLKYPPLPGSIKVHSDKTRYYESQVNLLETDQFFVDENSSTIIVKGRVPKLTIEYIPSYVFVNSIQPRKIMLYYNKIFTNTTGSILLGYDYTINLRATVSNNDAKSVVKDFKLLAKNDLSSKLNIVNEIGMEF